MSAGNLLAQAAGPTNFWEWMNDSSTRAVTGDIPSQVWTTLWHSLLAFTIAAGVAIPRRCSPTSAGGASTWVVNLGRIIPTVTILAVFVSSPCATDPGSSRADRHRPRPVGPPRSTPTPRGRTPPRAVGAARAMGLTEADPPPSSSPSPRRSSSPAAWPHPGRRHRSLAALFGRSLGQYITFGIANRDIYEVQAGAVLVAGLAISVDLVFWFVTRFLVPKPLRPAPSGRRAMQPVRPITSISIPTPSLGGNP